MLDHHIQREIVYALAFSEGLRFSELKPDGLENKAFDYHLKKVIRAESRLIDRAYATLLLAVRRPEDGAWLLMKRKSQPLIGLTGFLNAQPVASQEVTQTAADVCRQQTGLAGTFVVNGHGYLRIFRDGFLESFIHFTLLTCSDIQGELHQNSELAEYYWDTDPDWSAPDMLPNMQILYKMSQAPVGSFVEKTFDI